MKLKDILFEAIESRNRYLEAAKKKSSSKKEDNKKELELDDTWSFEVPLTARDVYNFYFLHGIKTYFSELLRTDFGEFLFKEYLNYFKKKYVKTFKELIARQIAKYMYRGRIDPDFPTFDGIDVKDTEKNVEKLRQVSPSELYRLMRKTFRSDMIRRNERWEEIATHYEMLNRSSSPNDILLAINMLNNAVHNTRTTVIDKFPNYYGELDAAFKEAATFKDLNQYIGKVDRDLWKLFRSSDYLEENLYKNNI